MNNDADKDDNNNNNIHGITIYRISLDYNDISALSFFSVSSSCVSFLVEPLLSAVYDIACPAYETSAPLNVSDSC